MTFTEFVSKYNGTKVDYDRAYGPQCVDLFRQYCQDVPGIPHTGSVDGAKDLYLNYNKLPLEKKYFRRLSAKSIKPQDILVWDKSDTNKYGHVAIALGIIDDMIIVFEQDGFKQDGAKITLRSRTNLLGVLRLK